MRSLSIMLLLCGLHAQAALTVTVTVFHDACGNGTGWIVANPNGGQGGYTFDWSPAPPVGQGTNVARQLVAGTYTVTVTDSNADVATASGTVQSIGTLLPGNLNNGSVTSCDGACNGSGPVSFYGAAWGGLAPYTASVLPAGNASVGSNHVYLGGLCPGTTYTCTVTDANGCTSTFNNIGVLDLNTPVLLDVEVTPSCAGGTTGSAVLTYDQVGTAGNMSQWGFWNTYPSKGTQVFMSNLPPGDHWVEAYPFDPAGNMGVPPMMGDCGLNTMVTIPVSTDPCGQVDGTVYVDLNGDCIQDANDVPYRWRVVRCEPGGHYELTNGSGQYSEALPYGAYTANITNLEDHAPLCPVVLPVPFNLNAGTPNITLDMAVEPLYGADMEALLTAGAPRPGFAFGYNLHALNNGAFAFGPFTATLTYDPILTYVSSSVAPTVNTPGLLQFDLLQLPAIAQSYISVVLQVPADPLLIGTFLDATLTLAPAPADTDPTNDTDVRSTLVVGAYDPNDKLVRTSTNSSSSQYYLDADTALDYTIRFQNTGNAEALHVRLVDTLSSTLDIGTLRLRGATHLFEAKLENDSILIIDFPDILLPDSASEPIASQGSFSFSIQPRAGIVPGTILANKADIYFDFNPPIRTNTAAVVAEFSTGLTRTVDATRLVVVPNPASDVVFINNATTPLLVVDATGRSVNLLPLGANTYDVRQLPAGCYTIHSTPANGLQQVARLMVVR